MKFSKSLFLAFAGLGLFACSNEEVVTESGNMDGNGVVEVKIVAPSTMSRTLGNATDGNAGDKVQVKGTLYVKLTAAEGGATKEVVLGEDATGTTTLKFWGVKTPTLIEAWINDGDKVNSETSIVNGNELAMQAMPEAIPAYGSNGQFNLTGKVETNGGKTYEMYETSVTMNIPVARLEVSGIKHAGHPNSGDEETCKYETLTIDGIYLDKILATKGATSVTDYKYPEEKSTEGTTVIPAPILWDAISDPNNFLQSGSVWPAVAVPAQAYAFNFYPSKTMPILKIYFANATAVDDNNPVSQPRYAMIKSYNKDENFQFEAGKIYRIKDVTLLDKNIIGDEEGNTYYGVDVTVTEAQWTIVDTSAEWVTE